MTHPLQGYAIPIMNRYKIVFGDKMGCLALGYCEREGRDRDEEHRRYAEFLVKEGYTVISCEGEYAMVAVDAERIVRTPAMDPAETFPLKTMTRAAIAEELTIATVGTVAPDDRRLTAELCRDFAREVGERVPEYESLGEYDELLHRYAKRAGFETPG